VAGLLSEANGPTHQAVEDIALMRGVPPMSILCPADIEDMLAMLPGALKSDGPVYFRYNPLPARTEHQPFVLGKAEQLFEGDDVAVITYGTLFSEAYDAVRLLREEGLAVRLINCRSLKPLDESVILPALTECRLIVTVEDHFRTGGLFAILSELCLQQRIAPDVRSISLGNRWFAPLMMDQLLEREGLDAVSLAARVRTWLDA
jgi:transketolase